MQDDSVCPREGHEPYSPTDEEVQDAIEEFDVLEGPHYDDDYVEMHSRVYRRYIRVYKWFKEEYEKYKCLSHTCFRKEEILLERIKWLEIEKEELQSKL